MTSRKIMYVGSYLARISCIVALLLVSQSGVSQRSTDDAEQWLHWNSRAREAYVEGLAWGDSEAYLKGCNNVIRKLPAETRYSLPLSLRDCADPLAGTIDVKGVSMGVTEFYKRFPDSRDIKPFEIALKLMEGLSLEKIHAFPFEQRMSAK
jgi:hypothetical protein